MRNMLYKNKKLKISAPTSNNKFELPNGFYSVSDNRDYFEYILKTYGGNNSDNSSIRIYINKIEKGITFEIKIGHYLEFLTPETIELFGTTKSKKLWMKMVEMCII